MTNASCTSLSARSDSPIDAVAASGGDICKNDDGEYDGNDAAVDYNDDEDEDNNLIMMMSMMMTRTIMLLCSGVFLPQAPETSGVSGGSCRACQARRSGGGNIAVFMASRVHRPLCKNGGSDAAVVKLGLLDRL